MNESLPITINITRLSCYNLSPDEVVLLEFLLFKQNYFGAFSWFYYSQRRMITELKIKRSRLEKILSTFKDMGFLNVRIGLSTSTNNSMSYFMVDFSILSKDSVLSQIIDKDSYFYDEMQNALIEAVKRPF